MASLAYSVCAVNQNEDFRGQHLKLVCDNNLWVHEKRSLTKGELKNKQAMWDFFSSVPFETFQKSITVVDKTWVDIVLQLEKSLRQRPHKEGVFFEEGPPSSAPSKSSSTNSRRRSSLPGRSGKIRKDDTGEYTFSTLFRSWTHIFQLYPSISESQAAYRLASESLRECVRIADTKDKCDSLTFCPELVADRAKLWTLLDDISLHGFATAMPPISATNPKELGAETPWFSVMQVYSLGAFIANKIELTLWREYRAWCATDPTGRRPTPGAPRMAEGEATVATFPGASKQLMMDMKASPSGPGLEKRSASTPQITAGGTSPFSPAINRESATSAAVATADSMVGSRSTSNVRTVVTIDPEKGTPRVVLSPIAKYPGTASMGTLAAQFLQSGLSDPLTTAPSPIAAVSSTLTASPVMGSATPSTLEKQTARSSSGLLSKSHLAAFWDSLKAKDRYHIIVEGLNATNGAYTITSSSSKQRSDALVKSGNSSSSILGTRSPARSSFNPAPARTRTGLAMGSSVSAYGMNNVVYNEDDPTGWGLSTQPPRLLEPGSADRTPPRGQFVVPAALRVSSGSSLDARASGVRPPQDMRLGRGVLAGASATLGSRSSKSDEDGSVGEGAADESYDAFDATVELSALPSAIDSVGGAGSVADTAGPIARPDVAAPTQYSDMMSIWPLKMLSQDGDTVVQDLYLMKLSRVDTQEEEVARGIGYRLQSRWAETNAMDLILAEEESATSKKSSNASSSGSKRPPSKKADPRASLSKARSMSVTTDGIVDSATRAPASSFRGDHSISRPASPVATPTGELPTLAELPGLLRQLSSSSESVTTSKVHEVPKSSLSVGDAPSLEVGSWHSSSSRKARRNARGGTQSDAASVASGGTTVSAANSTKQAAKSKEQKGKRASSTGKQAKSAAKEAQKDSKAGGTAAQKQKANVPIALPPVSERLAASPTGWPQLSGRSAPGDLHAVLEEGASHEPTARWSAVVQKAKAAPVPKLAPAIPAPRHSRTGSGSSVDAARALLTTLPHLSAPTGPTISISSPAGAGSPSPAIPVGGPAISASQKGSRSSSIANDGAAEKPTAAPLDSTNLRGENAGSAPLPSNPGIKEGATHQVTSTEPKNPRASKKSTEEEPPSASLPTEKDMTGKPALETKAPVASRRKKEKKEQNRTAGTGEVGPLSAGAIPVLPWAPGMLFNGMTPMGFPTIPWVAPFAFAPGPAGARPPFSFREAGMPSMPARQSTAAVGPATVVMPLGHPGAPSMSVGTPPPLPVPIMGAGFSLTGDMNAVSPDTGMPLWVEYQLHAELLKFQQWCVAHAKYRRLQELRVVWDIAKLAAENIPAASLQLFGSFMTGLAIPQSDVDVLIGGEFQPRHFHLLAQAVRNQPNAKNVLAIPTAQVPVIKLVASPPPLESFPGFTFDASDDEGKQLNSSSHTITPPRKSAPGNMSSSSLESLELEPAAISISHQVDHSLSPVHTVDVTTSRTRSPSPSPRASPSSGLQPGTAGQASSVKKKTREQIASAIQRFDALTRSPRISPSSSNLLNSLSPATSTLRRNSSSTSQNRSFMLRDDPEEPATAQGKAASPPAISPSSAAPSSQRLAKAMAKGWFDCNAPIRLDVTFESAAHRGLTTTWYTRQQLGMQPALGPLVLVLKQLLQGYSLNDAYTGGLHAGWRAAFNDPFLAQLSLQPVADGRSFNEFSAPYVTLPPELCGCLKDLMHVGTPIKIAMMPPLTSRRASRVRRRDARLSSASQITSAEASPTRTTATVDSAGKEVMRVAFVPYPQVGSGSKVSQVETSNDVASSSRPAPTQIPYMGPPAASVAAFATEPVATRSSSPPPGQPTYMQQHSSGGSPPGQEMDDAGSAAHLLPAPLLGKLFLRLLQFIGEEFNATTTGLSLKYGGCFPLKAVNVIDPLTLPDPFDDSNNVGRNCFRFFQVQQALRDARKSLQDYAAGRSWPSVATEIELDNREIAEPTATGTLPEMPEFPLLSKIIPGLRGL